MQVLYLGVFLIFTKAIYEFATEHEMLVLLVILIFHKWDNLLVGRTSFFYKKNHIWIIEYSLKILDSNITW